jgi:hypothetical protein
MPSLWWLSTLAEHLSISKVTPSTHTLLHASTTAADTTVTYCCCCPAQVAILKRELEIALHTLPKADIAVTAAAALWCRWLS